MHLDLSRLGIDADDRVEPAVRDPRRAVRPDDDPMWRRTTTKADVDHCPGRRVEVAERPIALTGVPDAAIDRRGDVVWMAGWRDVVLGQHHRRVGLMGAADGLVGPAGTAEADDREPDSPVRWRVRRRPATPRDSKRSTRTPRWSTTAAITRVGTTMWRLIDTRIFVAAAPSGWGPLDAWATRRGRYFASGRTRVRRCRPSDATHRQDVRLAAEARSGGTYLRRPSTCSSNSSPGQRSCPPPAAGPIAVVPDWTNDP